MSLSPKRKKVIKLLTEDPRRSDNSIAIESKCDRTYVGQIRRSLKADGQMKETLSAVEPPDTGGTRLSLVKSGVPDFIAQRVFDESLSEMERLEARARGSQYIALQQDILVGNEKAARVYDYMLKTDSVRWCKAVGRQIPSIKMRVTKGNTG